MTFRTKSYTFLKKVLALGVQLLSSFFLRELLPSLMQMEKIGDFGLFFTRGGDKQNYQYLLEGDTVFD
jgi:hypothetical protein